MICKSSELRRLGEPNKSSTMYCSYGAGLRGDSPHAQMSVVGRRRRSDADIPSTSWGAADPRNARDPIRPASSIAGLLGSLSPHAVRPTYSFPPRRPLAQRFPPRAAPLPLAEPRHAHAVARHGGRARLAVHLGRRVRALLARRRGRVRALVRYGARPAPRTRTYLGAFYRPPLSSSRCTNGRAWTRSRAACSSVRRARRGARRFLPRIWC